MKILAVSSLSDAPEWRKDKTTSPVDQWRIVRPYKNLQKRYGVKVDFKKTLVAPQKAPKRDFDEEKAAQETLQLFKKYDLVVSSYFQNAIVGTLAIICSQKTGTPLVIDVDDDWWSIPKDNPFWLRNDETVAAKIRWLLAEAPHLTTTNEILKGVYLKYRPQKNVHIIPNMISLEEYSHPPFDNGDRVVVGWFGGSSHYKDINESGFLKALQKIMHEHKNVYFEACGALLDTYLPKQRVRLIEPVRGLRWLELFKSLRFDVGVAPLLDTPFANGKSDIKWQEYACMGAAFIGSNVGPYKRTVLHNIDGLTVANTEEGWYNALKKLVINKDKRKELATNARRRVVQDFAIENKTSKVWEVVRAITKDRVGDSNI